MITTGVTLSGPAQDILPPQAGQELGTLSNWHFLNFFGLGWGWQTPLDMCAWTVNNFWRSSFTHVNLSLLAPYFWLFQLCLSATYRVVPWAAAWLACHLVQSWALQWFEMRTFDTKVWQWCLRFSEQCWYQLKPSQTWRCVDRYISTDVTEALARYKSTHCHILEDWIPHLAELALQWLPCIKNCNSQPYNMYTPLSDIIYVISAATFCIRKLKHLW